MDTTSMPPDLQLQRKRARHIAFWAWMLLLIGGSLSIGFSVYCARTYHLPPILYVMVGVGPMLMALVGSHLTSAFQGETWIKVIGIITTVLTVGLTTSATIQVLWRVMQLRSIGFGLVPDMWDIVAINAILSPHSAMARPVALQSDRRGDPEITLTGDSDGHPDLDPDGHPESHPDLDPETTPQGHPDDGGQGHPDDGEGEGPDHRREGVGMIAVERLKRTGTRLAGDDQIAEAITELLDTYGTGLTPYRIVNELRGRKGSIGEDRAGRVLKQVLEARKTARTG
jgi:hypothetical protein